MDINMKKNFNTYNFNNTFNQQDADQFMSYEANENLDPLLFARAGLS